MHRPDRPRLRLATRVLLLQLGTVALVVVLCTGAYLAMTVQQLRAESESSALSIARTVAEDPTVRGLVSAYSAADDPPPIAELRSGELQRLGDAVVARTGALFVVVTDDHGVRLSHPDPSRLGQVVSTPFQRALDGHEVVEWETGTLGESARAKVPVLDPGTGRPVGEVSVGFARASVFDDLPELLAVIAAVVLVALALAVGATLLMRRRWERLTLGVQPEELIAMVQNRTAVLDGVDDGVLAVDPDGIVRVCNAAAMRMLGVGDPVGRPLTALTLPPAVLAAVTDPGRHDGVVHDDRVLYLDRRPVEHNGRALGEVLIVRDRTALVALSERLETVRAMTAALRVQRHEFANRMHIAAGLLEADRTDDARAFLSELVARGPVGYPVLGLGALDDPFLQAFLGAKGIEAGERGVTLRIAPETHLLGTVDEAEDVAAVLGNLLDNAASAAVAAPEPRWVEVALLDDGDALVITVADSGTGIPDGADVFTRSGDADPGSDDAHGHGIGLPLSREIARRRGGDLWVVDNGGDGTGAVFAARVNGAVLPPGRGSS